MSGITDKELYGWSVICERHPNTPTPISGRKLGEYIAEIRHQRAENKELRASYERVEKYAQDLLQEREVFAAMVPSK